jgi:hypothetical protein
MQFGFFIPLLLLIQIFVEFINFLFPVFCRDVLIVIQDTDVIQDSCVV